MQRQEKLNLSWFLRHPLVATCILLAMTVLLPYLRVGERLKLWALLPVARAAGPDAESTPEDQLSEDERNALTLRAARERAAALNEENHALREALRQRVQAAEGDMAKAFGTPLPEAVDARVVFKGDASTWRHSCVINRGSRQGIKDGMPVVAGRTLIGRTFMVAEDHSIVQLLTDPGFAASCVIVDLASPELRVRGLLRGDGSSRPHMPRLELDDVAVGEKVKPGMAVVTNDFSGQFPLGLAVGEVREVIPQSGFLQVRIDAWLDLDSLEIVQVLLHERPGIEQQAVQLIRKKK
ncbi:Cell shape-determining protein MreC [Planctomycetaceae bacterium]|nr:Cell shape-determining protein MreC [Planctomycetaceae bacterium]